MTRLLRILLEASFRVLFSFESHGASNLPRQGGAIVAANHPSYLDPLLLSLASPRPIRFMAWQVLFRLPLLGSLIRAFGAFPVDTRPGRGRSAYETARALLEQGELVGIFPEGGRSRTAWLEPSLRSGAARLALETGLPLVPATIVGAFRAWPHFRSLPKPARVKVRFHQAITSPWSSPSAEGEDQEQALAWLLAELRRRVEGSLLPGVKADLRLDLVWRSPSRWPRAIEWAVLLASAVLAFGGKTPHAAWPCLAYAGYLLADRTLLPPSRLTKWARDGTLLFVSLLLAHLSLPWFDLPRIEAGGALLAVVAGAAFPYLYERGRTVSGFLRGFVCAVALGWATQFVAPLALGFHASLPLFCAAYAWERRSVFWRWATPLLLGYSLGVPLWLGAGPRVLPYVLAALVAWVATLVPALDRRPGRRGLALQSSGPGAPFDEPSA